MSPAHGHRLPRILLFFAYLLLGLSAVAAFFVPLVTFTLVSWQVWIYAWAIALTLGGLVGAMAAVLRSIPAELVGIVLLATGYVAYTVLLGYRALDWLFNRPEDINIAGTLYVLGTSIGLVLLLVRRYAELWRIMRTMPRTGSGES